MKAKENEGKKLFIIFILLVVTYSIGIIGMVSATPADPGHGAPAIGPGTFEGGFYVFPNNLSVTQNFSVDTNTLYVDSVLHRIGIGTDSPDYILHGYGASNPAFSVEDSTNNIRAIMQATNSGVSFGSIGTGAYVTLISGSGSEAMRILSGGNVGIGIVNPEDELSVDGTVNATDFVCDGGSCINAVELNSDVAGLGLNTTSGVLAVNILSPGGGIVVSGDAVVLNQSCGNNEILKSDASGNWACAADDTGAGAWSVSGTYVYNDTSAVTVGIGNNTPVTKLAISSSSDQLGIIDSEGSQEWRLSANSNMLYVEDENTGAIPFKIEDGADTDTLIIDDAGNVGIGTTGPSAPLHIDASATAEALFINSSSTSNVYIAINSTSSIREFEIGVTGSANGWGSDKFYIRDETAGQGRLVIDSSGNVGINTTTPQNTLNVIGDINFTGLIYGNGSQLTDMVGTPADTEGAVQFYDGGNFGGNASLFFFNKTTGRIGLGTTDPRSLLEIREDFRGTTGIGFGGEYADIWWDSHDNYGFWFTNRVNNTGAHTIFRFDSDETDIENMELRADGSVLMYHNLAVGVVGSKIHNAKLLIEGTDFISTFYADYRPDEDIFLTPGKATGNIYIPRGSLILTTGSTGSSAKFGIEASASDDYMMMITSDGGTEGDILTINESGEVSIGGNLTIAGNITPSANNTYSLGTPDLVWKHGYFGPDSLYIGDIKLSVQNNELRWNNEKIEGLWTNSSGDITTTANVGIGDTDPDAKLEVSDTTTPQFRITYTEDTDYGDFAVDDDGNLTISSSSGNVIIKLG